MRFSRKSQAAMEFLLNYGWVILIVTVIIGALSYFGVLNPKALLPEKCVFKAGFDCLDYGVVRYVDENGQSSGGAVKLKLLSSLGETATIESINFVSGDIYLSCTNPSNTQLSPGKAEYILFKCIGTFPEKEKVKLEISGKYYTTSTSFTKEIYGELTSKVITVPKPIAGVEISLIPEGQWALVDQQVQYQVKIINTGTDIDRYKIYIDGNAQPVEMTILAQSDRIYTFPLTFTVAGDHSTLIRVESTTDPSVNKEDSVTTNVRTAPVYDFDLSVSPDPHFKIVKSGGFAEYTVIVQNLGFGGIVKLETETLSGSPSQISLSKNNFKLPSGDEESVTMTVTPLSTDILVKFSLTGLLQGKTHTVTGIQTLVACKGFTTDISNAKVYFFNSKIDFGGHIAVKEDDSYLDIILPTSYKITITGSAGTDTITVAGPDPADAEFNIVKTGLVSSINVVPVVTAGGSDVECSSKQASVSDVKNFDCNTCGLPEEEVHTIWKVWDDGGSSFGSATPTTEDKFSGEKSLLVAGGGCPAFSAIPNLPNMLLSEPDHLIFAYKDKVGTTYGGFDLQPQAGGLYYLGCFPCNTPGGRIGGFQLIYGQGCYLGYSWKLIKASFDDITNGVKVNGVCTHIPRPTSKLQNLYISTCSRTGTSSYYDTIYFYK